MDIREQKIRKQPGSVTGELTSPFGLDRHLKQFKAGFDPVPILDMLVLALLLSLLFTRYLIFPGVRVDLPKTELSIQQEASRVVVLTIANNGMLFFKGGVYRQNSIEKAFRQYFAGGQSEATVLLLKTRASMDIQQFLDLCQMAQEGGFSEVQIAADPSRAAPGITTENRSGQANDFVLPAL